MTPPIQRTTPTRRPLPGVAPKKTPVPQQSAMSQNAQDLPKLAFDIGRLMVFVTFGMIAEFLFFLLHFNTYIAYLVIPLAWIAVVAAGGIGRTLRHRAAWYWMMFWFFMMLSVPFSTWLGGSVVGGLATNWEHVNGLFYTIGGAAVVNLVNARVFGATDEEGRISLDNGAVGMGSSIGNSNDLASHLILVLPFLLFIATDSRRSAAIRYPLLAGVAYGFWIILGTASRGALIAIGVMFLFTLWRASAFQRMAFLVVGLVLAVAVPLCLPTATVLRLASLFGGEHEEAKESQESRTYLLQQSLLYTLQHPVFGVGPDQFSNYEGMMSNAKGEHGEWHATHNSYTQISSECGVPALVCLLAGIGSALATVSRTGRRAKRAGVPEIARACMFYQVAMAGFLASIFFLANAYRYYLPAMVGLAIAIGAAGNRFLNEKEAAETAVPPATVRKDRHLPKRSPSFA